jgi:cellobiose-specific phosphotransferase system component IIC
MGGNHDTLWILGIAGYAVLAAIVAAITAFIIR